MGINLLRASQGKIKVSHGLQFSPEVQDSFPSSHGYCKNQLFVATGLRSPFPCWLSAKRSLPTPRHSFPGGPIGSSQHACLLSSRLLWKHHSFSSASPPSKLSASKGLT